jgi:catechol 2,3-dioxygenase-like lactoylglutathione lyase family enzyme
MEPRISLITLGVGDLRRARAFYEALGFGGAVQPDDEVVFFPARGMILGLWDRRALAADSHLEDRGGFGGVALAHNVRSPAEVDAVLAAAERGGATITRPGAPTAWGGYSGVFADPDGHPWEVAHNPGWTLADDGSVSLGT